MEIILKSLMAAAVTAGILIIAKFSGPRLAGAIGGVPIIFAISYILLTMRDKAISRELLIGGIYGAVAGIFFSVFLLLLNAQFPKYHWLNFAIAYLGCFLLAAGIAHYTTK